MAGCGPRQNAWSEVDECDHRTCSDNHSRKSSIDMQIRQSWSYTLDEALTSDVWRWRELKFAAVSAITIAVLLLAAFAAFDRRRSDELPPLLYVYQVLILLLILAFIASKRWKPKTYFRRKIMRRIFELLRKHESTIDQVVPPFIAWLICFMISVSAPSRGRQLLSDFRPGDFVDYPCEEATITIWLGIVMLLVASMHQLSNWSFAIFVSAVNLQYTLVGLAFPRPECSEEGGTTIMSGPLLRMTPILASIVQLLFFSLGLFLLHFQFVNEKLGSEEAALLLRAVDELALEDVASRASFREQHGGHGIGDEFVLHTGYEELLMAMQREETRWRHRLQTTYQALPPGCACLAWVAVVSELLDNITDWRDRLHQQSNNFLSTCDSTKMLEAVCEADVGVEAVSQFVSPDTVRTAQKHHSSAPVPETIIYPRRHHHTLTTLPSAMEVKIGDWDFDAFEINATRNKRVLQIVGFELLRSFAFITQSVLTKFLDTLASMYNSSLPYHSDLHAADVSNSFYTMFTKTGMMAKCAMPESSFASGFLAALGHDVGHPGRNNMFLITGRDHLAITYNDRSVLECYHASATVRLIEDVGLYSQLPQDEVLQARGFLTSLILATDTQKHLDELGSFRVRMTSVGTDSTDIINDPSFQMAATTMIFRASDIGHSAKPWKLHAEWSKRVCEEFHQQGDEEKSQGMQVSPLCDRDGFRVASSQCGFLQFICLPTWRELSRLEDIILGLVVPSRSASPLLVVPPRRGSLRWSDNSRTSMLSVAPRCTSTGSNSVSDDAAATAERRHLKRWLSETCLQQCEDNFQIWRVEADMEKALLPSESASQTGSSRKNTGHSLGNQRSSYASRHGTRSSSNIGLASIVTPSSGTVT